MRGNSQDVNSRYGYHCEAQRICEGLKEDLQEILPSQVGPPVQPLWHGWQRAFHALCTGAPWPCSCSEVKQAPHGGQGRQRGTVCAIHAQP